MVMAEEERRLQWQARGQVLFGALPLWLFSLAITVEGFPRPPIPGPLAVGAFGLAIVVSVVLLINRWMTLDLLLGSLVPLVLVGTFDEISTAYKTPFIFVCALLLTMGILGYQYHRSARWRGLILLMAIVATLALAFHATDRYWKMTDALGFGNCFPDASDCAPIPPGAPSWWALMFGF
jgi:hypothetical protein